MYNNPYYQNYNSVSNVDRINNQIAELEKMKTQIATQTTQPITQNFQLAPSGNMKYANTLEDVEKEVVYTDTPYFSKDMSVLWLKKASGGVKTYELKEMVYQDEKDAQIGYLMAKIEKLENDMKKKEIEYAKSSNDDVNEQFEDEKSSSVPNLSTGEAIDTVTPIVQSANLIIEKIS